MFLFYRESIPRSQLPNCTSSPWYPSYRLFCFLPGTGASGIGTHRPPPLPTIPPYYTPHPTPSSFFLLLYSLLSLNTSGTSLSQWLCMGWDNLETLLPESHLAFSFTCVSFLIKCHLLHAFFQTTLAIGISYLSFLNIFIIKLITSTIL